MDTYYGATKAELETISRDWQDRFHIKFLLPHHGDFRLTDQTIDLAGWRSIALHDLQKVELGNDNLLSSRQFATQSRLFFLKAAQPLRLYLSNGEVIYLYVNWGIGLGLSDNRKLFQRLKEQTIRG